MRTSSLADRLDLDPLLSSSSLPQFFRDSSVVKVRHRPQTERDGVGKLSKTDDYDGLQDLLLAEPIGA